MEIPVDWVICLEWNSGDYCGLGLSASSGPAETLVDWVYLLPLVDQWRFLWTGFFCLKWNSGDYCGLGLSASCSGAVEIPVDWVYLPLVVQRRLLWTGFICFV